MLILPLYWSVPISMQTYCYFCKSFLKGQAPHSYHPIAFTVFKAMYFKRMSVPIIPGALFSLSWTHANQASTPPLLWNCSCTNDHTNSLLTPNNHYQYSILILLTYKHHLTSLMGSTFPVYVASTVSHSPASLLLLKLLADLFQWKGPRPQSLD